MVQSSTLTCLDCGYSWKPRKDSTRYQRQCPRCKHTHFGQTKITGNTQAVLQTTVTTVKQPIAMGTQWPRIVYDLQGILGASSPENALVRAYELVRGLSPYKYRHNLQSLEGVFEFLERRAAEGNRKAVEAQERLQRILNDPELVFYEVTGTELTAPDWYDALRKEGYKKGFLEFVNEIIEKHFERQGVELGSRED